MSQRPSKDGARRKADQSGFYGKAPTHGDFVSSGVEASLQDAIDSWIQAGMQASERTFGHRWRDLFHATTPWRFIVEGGIWGQGTVAGVLLPSTDRIGRSFPFVILAHLADYHGDPRLLYFDKTWFTAAEALAETSKARDFDLTVLPLGIQRLRTPRARTPEGEEVERDQPYARTEPVSIWWTIDADSRKALGFQTNGAPQASDFSRMLQASEVATEPPEPLTPQSTLAAPQKSFTFERSHATNAGTRLAINGDALLICDAPRIFALADGLGDGAGAADAARLVIGTLAGTPACGSLAELVQEIKGKLGRAHGTLQAYPVDGKRASIAVFAMQGDSFAVVWAGDVRGFIQREGMMRPLTRDHVTVGLRRTLSRSVGAEGQLVPEVVDDGLMHGDRFVLCSAPLLRVLGERTIAEILSAMPIAEVAEALVQEALIAGVRDNISAIAIGAFTR